MQRKLSGLYDDVFKALFTRFEDLFAMKIIVINYYLMRSSFVLVDLLVFYFDFGAVFSIYFAIYARHFYDYLNYLCLNHLNRY